MENHKDALSEISLILLLYKDNIPLLLDILSENFEEEGFPSFRNEKGEFKKIDDYIIEISKIIDKKFAEQTLQFLKKGKKPEEEEKKERPEEHDINLN